MLSPRVSAGGRSRLRPTWYVVSFWPSPKNLPPFPRWLCSYRFRHSPLLLWWLVCASQKLSIAKLYLTSSLCDFSPIVRFPHTNTYKTIAFCLAVPEAPFLPRLLGVFAAVCGSNRSSPTNPNPTASRPIFKILMANERDRQTEKNDDDLCGRHPNDTLVAGRDRADTHTHLQIHTQYSSR